MMLKVFLVEDEFVVREGIKNNIDWASRGYEFCGEASDGELAFHDTEVKTGHCHYGYQDAVYGRVNVKQTDQKRIAMG